MRRMHHLTPLVREIGATNGEVDGFLLCRTGGGDPEHDWRIIEVCWLQDWPHLRGRGHYLAAGVQYECRLAFYATWTALYAALVRGRAVEARCDLPQDTKEHQHDFVFVACLTGSHSV